MQKEVKVLRLETMSEQKNESRKASRGTHTGRNGHDGWILQ
jgi:hypothetical protein